MIGALLAVKTSEYQLFKLRVLDVIPVSKDAAHVYVGMGCLLLALLIFRAPLRSYWGSPPGIDRRPGDGGLRPARRPRERRTFPLGREHEGRGQHEPAAPGPGHGGAAGADPKVNLQSRDFD